MTDGIKVSFGALEAARAGIKTNHANLVGTLSDLRSNLDAMVSTWDGDAQTAYTACRQNWEAAAEAMAVLLERIGTAVGTANENYQGAENAVRNTW